MRTYDQNTIDSAGAFLVGELERLDPALNMPLVSVTWNRDIDLREDVTIGDESSSFTVSSLAAPGGESPAGKNWIGKDSSAIAGIGLDISKIPHGLHLWGMQVGYTIPELVSAQQLGRPVDSQKHDGLRLKHNMDVDEMVYIGDTAKGATGLVNNAAITPGSITKLWTASDKTPEEILADLNALIYATYAASGFAVCPSKVLLPPLQYGVLTKPVTTAGSVSLLKYMSEQCMSAEINGRPLDIKPLKWLTGRGASGKNRAVAYTQDKTYVRYPMVPLQRTPLEYRGISQLCTYFGRLGVMEFVYPETVGYADGL